MGTISELISVPLYLPWDVAVRDAVTKSTSLEQKESLVLLCLDPVLWHCRQLMLEC